MKKSTYLARFGKVFGPFSDEEIEGFQASGKINEYFWIWNEQSALWKPLDPPPAPLTPSAGANVYEFAPEGELGPSPKELGFPKTSGSVPVVCHNYKAVLSGKLQRMTETGCELLSEHGSFTPTFVNRSTIVMNLLDAGSGKLMNVSGRICAVKRMERGWSYQIRWEQRPEI